MPHTPSSKDYFNTSGKQAGYTSGMTVGVPVGVTVLVAVAVLDGPGVAVGVTEAGVGVSVTTAIGSSGLHG